MQASCVCLSPVMKRRKANPMESVPDAAGSGAVVTVAAKVALA